jgi:hypothetical protein
MSAKISFIIATVGAAVVVGVPAAWGGNSVGDRQDKVARISPGVVELVVSKNGALDSYLMEALSRPVPVRAVPDKAARISPGVVELIVSKNGALDSYLMEALSRPVPVRAVPDTAPLAPAIAQRAPVSSVATSADTGPGLLDWSQVGIGFGAGIVLALGFVLALRYTRVRSLAH